MMGNVGAVFLFEWRRAMTIPRLAWWFALAAFPVFIIGLIRYTAPADTPRELWIGFLFALIPMLVSMLGTFLWTTPAISAELERRSWVYLTVRPNGGTAVLVGKYLAAVAWALPPALVGLTIAVLVIGGKAGWQLWWPMALLACLSCPAYGAIYLLLGVLMPRRAMVLAVAYTLIFELIISFVPAVVNQITIQYRLRALMVQWCELEIPGDRNSGVLSLIGEAPAWQHISVLFVMTIFFLIASVLVLRASEFSSSAESDV